MLTYNRDKTKEYLDQMSTQAPSPKLTYDRQKVNNMVNPTRMLSMDTGVVDALHRQRDAYQMRNSDKIKAAEIGYSLQYDRVTQQQVDMWQNRADEAKATADAESYDLQAQMMDLPQSYESTYGIDINNDGDAVTEYQQGIKDEIAANYQPYETAKANAIDYGKAFNTQNLADIRQEMEKVQKNPDFYRVSDGAEPAPDFSYDTIDRGALPEETDDTGAFVDAQNKFRYLTDEEYQRAVNDSTMTVTTAGISADSQKTQEYDGLKKMTSQERRTFLYYCYSGRWEEAQQYVDALTPVLDARYQGQISQDMTELAADGPGGAFAATMMNLAYAPRQVESYIGTIAEGIDNAINHPGEYRSADPNAWYHTPANIVQSTTQGLTDQAETPFGKFMVQTGLSIGQYVTTLPFGPQAALAIMSSSAAGATAYQAAQSGATPGQAIAMGTLSGAIEYLTEKIPLDNLMRIVASPRMLKSTLKNLAKQSGIEGLEELISEYANTVTDQMIMGAYSQLNQLVDEYMSQGMTKQQAYREAVNQLYIINPVLAFTGGTISGGFMGGGASVMAGSARVQQNAQIGTEIQQSGATEDIVGAGLAMPEDTRAYKLAAEAQGKALSGRQEGEGRIGALYREIASTPTEDAAQYGERGREAYKAIITPESSVTAKKEFDVYYRTGKSGLSLSTLQTAQDTLTQTQEVAYEAGRADHLAAFKTGEALTRESSNGFKKSNYSKTLNRETVRALDSLAKAANVKITMAPATGDLGVNGFYDAETNTVYIAQDAANPALVVAKHEITHRVAKVNAEGYKVYRNYVVETLGQDYVDRTVKTKQALYERQVNQKLTYEGAVEEIVADFTETLLTDANEINKLVDKNRSLGRQILDAIKAFIRKARTATYKSAQAGKYGLDIETLEKAQSLWTAALKRNGTSETTQGESKAETTDEIKYSAMYRNGAESFDEMRDFAQKYRQKGNKESGKSYYRHTLPSGEVIDAAFNDVVHMVDEHGLTGAEFNALVNAVDDINNVREIRVMDWKGAHGGYIVSLQVSSAKGGGFVVLEVVSADRTFVKNAYLGEHLTIDKKSRSYTLQPQDFMPPTGNTGSALSVITSLQQYFYKIKTQNSQEEKTKYSLKDSEGRTLTPEQAEFFKDSHVRDEDGNLLVVYHGTGRADRVGYVFDPERATSGPMAFFTSSKDIADNYARNKTDTSMAYDEDYDNYETQFRVKIQGKYPRDIPIKKAWGYIPMPRRAEIRRLAGELTLDSEYNEMELQPGNKRGIGNFDEEIRRSGGNVITALIGGWLNGGTLFDEEARFLDVLEMTGITDALKSAGLDAPYYKDPNYREEKTYEVYLNITHPFETSDMRQDDISALKKASETVDYAPDDVAADMWYKNDIAPDEWIKRLNEDIEDGTFHAWTSIPDWVSNVLKERGYDGIADTGGKMGGDEHQVFIPFGSEQIKSVDNENPTSDPDIRYSLREDKSRQAIGSAKTSINSSKLPAVFGKVSFEPGTVNLDIGGGKFDNATDFLRSQGVTSYIYDPYNRTDKHNRLAASATEDGRSDTVTISNVLNVIAEQSARDLVLENAVDALKPDGVAYITIYEGDGTGTGKETTSGYQLNRKTATYVAEVEKYFKDVTVKNGVITARGPKKVDIRYSLKSESKLAEENLRLREMNAALKEQFKLTKGFKVDVDTVRKFTADLLAEYSSSFDRDEVLTGLSLLFDEYRNGGEDAYDKALKEARNIASGILSESVVLNDDLHREYKNLRKYLRSSRISISEQYRGDFDRAGGYDEFRKRNFGRFTLTDKGVPMDTIYSEMSYMFPEFFDQEAISNQADQIIHTAEVLDWLKPVYENPFDGYMSEATEIVAMEIMDAAAAAEPAKPTYADKQKAKADKVKEQRVANLRDQQKARIEKMKEHFKDRVAELLDREADRRDELVEKLKDKYAAKEGRARERRQAAIVRAKIRRVLSDLKSRLNNPSDKKHVPDQLRTAVKTLLDVVDLSRGMLKEGRGKDLRSGLLRVREALDDVIREGSSDGYIDYDPDIPVNLANLSGIDDKTIGKLTLDEYQAVYEIVKSVRGAVQSYNKLFSAALRAGVAEAGEKVMDELRTDKAYQQSHSRLRQLGRRLFQTEMLSSFDFFEEMGPTFYKLFMDLRQGLDKKIRSTSYAEKYMQALLGDAKVREWTGDKAKTQSFELSSGTLDLTVAQIMSLYLLNRQEGGQNHIYNGGITLKFTTAVRDGKRVVLDDYNVTRVTQEDVGKIITTLTPEQKRVAEGISRFFTQTTSEWGNEVSLKMYGYRKFTEANYFPIVSNDNYILTHFAEGQDGTLANRGSTKSRVKNASNPILIEDAFDVYARQSDFMSSYNAFVIPLSDMQKVFNYKSPEGTGSVKQSIQKKYGRDATAYFKQFMADLNGGIRTDFTSELASALTKKYKAAVMGLNLRVILQQPTSYIRAAAVMDSKYLTKGFLSKPNWDEVLKHSPIALWRDMGYFALDVGRQMKDVFIGSKSMTDKFMAAIGAADRFAWGRLWNAAKYETEDIHPEMTVGSMEYWDQVAERFREMVDNTQVIDTVFHRSQLMRSQSSLTKMVTSFMSEPTRIYNMLRKAGKSFAAGDRRQGVRTTGTVLTSMIVNALVTALIDVYRDSDRDDESFWSMLVKKLFGTSKGLYLDGNLTEQFTGMIPFVKDVISLIQGYDVGMIYMEGVDAVIKSTQRTIDYAGDVLSGETPKYRLTYIMKDLVGSIGLLTGIPTKSFFRELEALLDNTFDVAGATMAKYAKMRLLYSMNTSVSSVRAMYYDMLFSVSENGSAPDKEAYDTIRADLIANGYEDANIDSAMKARLKAGGDFAKAQSIYFNKTLPAVQSSPLYKKLGAEYQEKAVDYVEQYANAMALADESEYGISENSWLNDLDDAMDANISPDEYILFKIMMSEERGKDSLTQDEAIDIIDSLGLRDAQSSVLFHTLYDSDKNNPFD